MFVGCVEEVEPQCLADLNEAATRAQRQLLYAYMRADALPWPARVRVAVAAFLVFLDEEPVVAEVLFGESLRERPLLAWRRAQLLEQLGLYIHTGGWNAEGSRQFEDRSAERMLGVAATVIETHLSRADPRPLTCLTGTLTGLIVMPYLGAGTALKQMENEGIADR
jgi:hypothetical protein